MKNEAEGVAAPLEPTPPINTFFRKHLAWHEKKLLAWQENVIIVAEAYAAEVSKNLQKELALWKRSMCVLYEIIEEKACPVPSAAIVLVTSSIIKLQADLRKAKDRVSELEKEITALRTAQTAVTGTESHWRGRDAALRETK